MNTDTIEITVLGNGYGECILIHYGDNDWLIVDSFMFPGTREPAAKVYLESINVDISESVKYVVVTHADTDHIRGISDLYSQARNAKLVMSAALREPKFLAMVEGSMPGAYSTASEKEEFAKLFSEMTERKRSGNSEALYYFGQTSRRILDDKIVISAASVTREIWTLSPSDETSTRAKDEIVSIFEAMVEKADGKSPAVGRMNKLPNNHTSVALWITVGDRNLLLGADLEENGDPMCGWTHVLNHAPRGKAEFFKIPHHGSNNGHHDLVWQDMVEEINIIAVTPYNKNRNPLPTVTDLERLSSLSSEGYVAGSIKPVATTLDRNTTRTLSRLGRTIKTQELKYGRVTFKSIIDDPAKSWTVETEGTVAKILAET